MSYVTYLNFTVFISLVNFSFFTCIKFSYLFLNDKCDRITK